MPVFLIVCLVLIGVIVLFFKQIMTLVDRKKKKYDSNKEVESKKIKLDTDIEGFDEVKRFDRDKYLEETFNQVFHAVEVDNWPSTYGYKSMEFKKDKITLKIEHSDYTYFKIKSITLTSGYNTFHYFNDLDESKYRFFYNIYSDNIKKENEDAKKRADESLSEIHKALGKDTIRDSKINKLLNDLR
jgi:hypothetical protein